MLALLLFAVRLVTKILSLGPDHRLITPVLITFTNSWFESSAIFEAAETSIDSTVFFPHFTMDSGPAWPSLLDLLALPVFISFFFPILGLITTIQLLISIIVMNL